ncbi:hypothetical protein AU184_07270 [Mycolicibacterium novocastrense]|nr:hypothetical protein AU183_25190 [Mycolicibacterium novocastrense]KUH74752.1 hypothetical protein AU072_12260 [Mycolicibacterium novocastrense]KUH76067.1 hypothetical protein AU184_07270 [Mycolicibacterium novocastrense]
MLKQRISLYASEAKCSYCDRRGSDEDPIAAPFDDFMDCFMVGVRQRFARADDEAVLFEDGDYVGATTYSSGEVAEEIFDEALDDYPDDVQIELLTHIQSVMLEDAWVRHDWQWLSEDKRLSYSWDEFKDLVKHHTRFLFMGWPKRHEYDPDELSPVEFFEALVALIVDLNLIGTVDGPLFRGRMFTLEPNVADHSASTLGPAPADVATANRMSPAGISMFYGASDNATAVAEIGVHSSDSWAVVGEFTAARELRVVDLSTLPDLPSIFDDDERAQSTYHSILFLRQFVRDLTLPVVLDGREHIDYVPTQVLTEYLRYSFPFRIDGLKFPSAHGHGHNFVIFYGQDFCSSPDEVGEYTRLILDPEKIRKYRVTTTIKDI